MAIGYYRIDFRILIRKQMLNDYWIAWVFRIVCLGYNMIKGYYRILGYLQEKGWQMISR